MDNQTSSQKKLPEIVVCEETRQSDNHNPDALIIDWENPHKSLNLVESVKDDTQKLDKWIELVIEILRFKHDPEDKGLIGPRFQKHIKNCFYLVYNSSVSELMYDDLLKLLKGEYPEDTDSILDQIQDTELRKYWEVNFEPVKHSSPEPINEILSSFADKMSSEPIRKLFSTGHEIVNINDYHSLIIILSR